MGIPDGSGWVRTPEPLVDELWGLERGEDEDECGRREGDSEEDGLEGVGNDNNGPRDDGNCDE